MIRLGVNIDHVATLRQARLGKEPHIIEAAFLCEKSGAHCLTLHLREDRRHIQDSDIYDLAKLDILPLNLEMALSSDIASIAKDVKPRSITLVPEKREELTTEGGLDVVSHQDKITDFVAEFNSLGIPTYLFIDPDKAQVEATLTVGAKGFELHTGDFANASSPLIKTNELNRLFSSAKLGIEAGLAVHAGHGLNYQNIDSIISMPGLAEVNIGHSIVSRAVMVGMERAVSDMLTLLISE